MEIQFLFCDALTLQIKINTIFFFLLMLFVRSKPISQSLETVGETIKAYMALIHVAFINHLYNKNKILRISQSKVCACGNKI